MRGLRELLNGSLFMPVSPLEAAIAAARRPTTARLSTDHEVKMALRRTGNVRARVIPSRYSGAKLRELRAQRGVGPVKLVDPALRATW